MTATLYADLILVFFSFILIPSLLVLGYLEFRRSIRAMSVALTKDDFLAMAKALYDLRVRQSRNPITRKPVIDIPDPEEDGAEFFNYFHYHIANYAIERSKTNKWTSLIVTTMLASGATLVVFFSLRGLFCNADVLFGIAFAFFGVALLGFSICLMILPGRNTSLIKEADEKLTLLFQEYKNGQAQGT